MDRHSAADRGVAELRATAGSVQTLAAAGQQGWHRRRVQPLDTTRFVEALAQRHLPGAAGAQEYWFDDLGTALDPFGVAAFPEPEVPRIESSSAGYEFFPIEDGGKARQSAESVFPMVVSGIQLEALRGLRRYGVRALWLASATACTPKPMIRPLN